MKAPKLQSRIVEAVDFDAANQLFYEKGWTDGLPVVPPTEERILKMLEFVSREPEEVIADVPQGFGAATVEKIAVNAVMAGCLPSYMPVVIAGVEAMCDTPFNLDGVQATTNPAGVALIINGPIRKELDINCGRNCLGQGWRANATIGRAIRLILINIGHGKPGESDQAIHGFPGKYSFCFGEDEEGSPWEPLHVEQGFKPEDSTVTAAAICSVVNCLCSSIVGITNMLKAVAASMGYLGSNNMLDGHGQPIALLTSGHATQSKEAGFSKADVKRFLYERAGFPASELPEMVRKERLCIIDGLVKPGRKAEDVMVVVAGGPETYHAQFLPTFGYSRQVTKRISVGK